MSSLAPSPDWYTCFAPYQHLWLAYSGGLDSTVLLDLLVQLPELRSKLSLLHVNHGISPNADHWETHCRQQAQRLGLSFFAESLSFPSRENLEARARDARHAIFAAYLQPGQALLLAQHQDDQAETLLLQLCRGAGVEGMAAMLAEADFAHGKLLRPLLNFSRAALEAYAKNHALSWVEDESNLDTQYSRNFIRQQIIPMLRSKWPGVSANLARAAEHCQSASLNAEALAKLDAKGAVLSEKQLDIALLAALEPKRASNLLRAWLRQHALPMPSSKMTKAILDELVFSRPDAAAQIRWEAVTLRRFQGRLYLLKPEDFAVWDEQDWADFPATICLNSGLGLQASPAKAGFILPKGALIQIRKRQGGEQLRLQAKTKALKKCLQTWNIAPWERDSLPLLYIDGQLAAIPGYAVSDRFWGEAEAYTLQLVRGDLLRD